MKPSRKLTILSVLLLLIAGQATGGELVRDEEESPTTRDLMLRSALLPGLGQLEQGRTGRSAAWAGGAMILAVGTFMAHNEYTSAATDFQSAETTYLEAIAHGNWDLDSAESSLIARRVAQERSDERYTTRAIFEVALVAWWAGNLLDVWLFERDDDDAESGDYGALPGNLSPVVRPSAVGLSWSIEF